MGGCGGEGGCARETKGGGLPGYSSPVLRSPTQRASDTGRHGQAVGTYFRYLRWNTLLNLLMGAIFIVFATVPVGFHDHGQRHIAQRHEGAQERNQGAGPPRLRGSVRNHPALADVCGSIRCSRGLAPRRACLCHLQKATSKPTMTFWAYSLAV